jgi:hypothetical protein
MNNFSSDNSGSYTQHFLQDKPGSPEAVERGCTCPTAENNFGRGRSKHGVVESNFATDSECPIHGTEVLLGILEENNRQRTDCTHESS